MVGRILRPRRPRVVSTLAVVYRTGRNQYHAAGVLGRARHCSEAAAVALHAVGPIIGKRDVIHKNGST